MYRDAPLTGQSCYKHAAAPMAAQCERCERALCDPCIVYDVSSPHCIDCARTARRRRAIGAAAKIGGALAAIAGGIVFVVTRPHPFDYGVQSATVVRLHNKITTERCDKRATLDYDEALLAAGDARGAISDTDAYFTKCGDWYRLRWVRYSAHEHLGEHEAAAAEAGKLMAHDPMDHDYPWWRGMAYEEMGKLDDAIRDYRRTMTLEPAVDRIPFNLASVLEQKGQLCEARQPILQFVRFHPDYARAPNVRDRLDRLRILGHCPPDPPPPTPENTVDF
jgi:tetratricopeptide (TPR) repeat protein